MKSLSQSSDDEEMSSINVIPFVDIVLVLLVIFMLTQNTIAKASMKVDLPSAAAAGSKVSSTVNVTILKSGELLFNGNPMTAESIRAAITDEVKRDAKTQAVIAGDKGVDYGRVMEVIDLVKQQGISTFALDVERAPGSN